MKFYSLGFHAFTVLYFTRSYNVDMLILVIFLIGLVFFQYGEKGSLLSLLRRKDKRIKRLDKIKMARGKCLFVHVLWGSWLARHCPLNYLHDEVWGKWNECRGHMHAWYYYKTCSNSFMILMTRACTLRHCGGYEISGIYWFHPPWLGG